MNLLQRIEETTVLSGGARRAIGEFILSQKDELYKYSIQEVADATETSKAALVRFAKELGFSGWREFLRVFAQEQREHEANRATVDVNYPFCEKTSEMEISGRMSALQTESIQDTARLMENAVLAEAVELLCRAKRIGMFGSGPYSCIAEMFAGKMLAMGKPAEVPTRMAYSLLANALGAQDCAIVISYSGNPTTDAASVLDVLKERRVPIIALTSEGESVLRCEADYVFTISSRENIYAKVAGFASESSVLYILNVLYSCCFAREYSANLDKKLEMSRIEAARSNGDAAGRKK